MRKIKIRKILTGFLKKTVMVNTVALILQLLSFVLISLPLFNAEDLGTSHFVLGEK